MSHKLDYEESPPRKPLHIRIWNGLGIAAAIVLACDFLSSLFLVAIPQPFNWAFHCAATIAAIFLLVFLLNKYFFQPMREAIQHADDGGEKKKNSD